MRSEFFYAISGRHVIISGASTGLGFALAEKVMREGINVKFTKFIARASYLLSL